MNQIKKKLRRIEKIKEEFCTNEAQWYIVLINNSELLNEST
jgi:hypothetical protein